MNRDRPSQCLEYIFAHPDLPSPCFILDLERLSLNADLLEEIQEKTGAKILLALKGFAAWSVFDLLSRHKDGPLWGTCASSIDEARLGKEEFGGEVHAFAAAWDEEEFKELLRLADHISFNSIQQWRRFYPLIQAVNLSGRESNPISAGLRINPEHSEGAVEIYNPCSPSSRLGIRQKSLPDPSSPIWTVVEGLHFHTLCEQDSQALENTLHAFEKNFNPYFKYLKWFNFGGGHHITRDGYDIKHLCEIIEAWQKKYPAQIYLEPGEAVALDAGWLLTKVLDIVETDMPVLILDTSAACHMPDVLEMPYTPDVWYKFPTDPVPVKAKKAGEDICSCRLAGKSCLAGDVIGEYSFPQMPKVGDRLVFADMAIYSMVKTTTFNGLRLPTIALHDWRKKEPFKILHEFGYEDFKCRLS